MKLQFDLKRKEETVVLENGDKKTEYVLRELSGKDRDFYLSKMSEKMRYEKGKPAGLKNFDGLQALLINLHLHTMDDVRVSVQEIQKFPASVVSGLFDACQSISSLGDEDEDEVGND